MNKNSESEVNHEPAEPELKDSLNSRADVWLGALSNASLMCFVGFALSIIFNDAGLLLGVASGAVAGGVASVFLFPGGCRCTGVYVRRKIERLLGKEQAPRYEAVALAPMGQSRKVNKTDARDASTTSSHDDSDSVDDVIVERPDLDLFQVYGLSGERDQDVSADNESMELAREAHEEG